LAKRISISRPKTKLGGTTAEKGESKVRLIKMFGLAALAAVAAMAFVGATSAMANGSTALCKTHEEPCLTVAQLEALQELQEEMEETVTVPDPPVDNHATSVHMVNEGVGRLLSSLATILCLNVLVQATPLGLGNPQSVHATAMEFTGCGTNANHTNCEVEVEESPLSNLLKTGLDTGSLTATNGQSRVICENIFGFIDIDCKYNTTGILFAIGGGHLTANETPVTEVGSKALCPKTSTLDGLLKGLVMEDGKRLDYLLG
jgi:hypothetical protein